MDIALIFKLFNNRAKIQRLFELVTPAFNILNPALPEIIATGNELLSELFPDFGRSIASPQPLASFDVKWLQTSLNTLGQKIPVDGYYGWVTREAVTMFQVAHNLDSDGWAGVETCSAIVVQLAKHGDKP